MRGTILRKHSLFKKDFFGIKRKLFLHRVTMRLRKVNHLKAKQLEYLLNMALEIGFPCNEEEENALKWVCDKYDTLIGEINDEMKRVREKIS